MFGVVEQTVSLAPKAGEDYKAVAAAVQVNPMAVLLGSSCPHHLMGTKEAFVDMEPSCYVNHVRGFNGAFQVVQGHGTVTLREEDRKQILVLDVPYVPSMQANLLSAGVKLKDISVQLKGSSVKLQDHDDEILLVSALGDVLGRARYTGQVICTDLHPYSTKSTMASSGVVALQTIASATKSSPDRWHTRRAHVGVDTIKSSSKHEVTTILDIKPSAGAYLPCVSCVGGKLAQHTFLDKGSDADEALAIIHINLCGPFQVAAKDGSLYFLWLKDRNTRYVGVRLVFEKWLPVVER
ncbi:unnamed protein product [Closterium sp. NIES-53]